MFHAHWFELNDYKIKGTTLKFTLFIACYWALGHSYSYSYDQASQHSNQFQLSLCQKLYVGF